MSKTPAAFLYRHNIVRIRLKDVLTTKSEQSLPPPGQSVEKTLPSGIVVQVVHHPNNTAAVLFPQFRRGYWLTRLKPDRPAPFNFHFRDALGNRVLDLFYDTNTDILGSRHELQAQGIQIYRSRDLTPAQRRQRWATIFLHQYPTRAPTILANPHDVPGALALRPRQTTLIARHKRTWIVICERAWWGSVRKGQAEKLQSQITASINGNLHKRPPWMRRIPGANFWRNLNPLNRRRNRWVTKKPAANGSGRRQCNRNEGN